MYDGYDCHFNSSQNKRGVAVLVNKKVSFLVQDQFEDLEENFLLLKAVIRGEEVILGSIYGPNKRDKNFFTILKTELSRLSNRGTIPVIIGGDWNCTFSLDPVNSNIDIFEMADLPNKKHSELVQDLCFHLQLVDPYRYKHFNSREFTFVPRNENSKNRSRIDFFLISESLIQCVTSCTISDTLQNRLFDHKAIRLELNVKKLKPVIKQKINNKILNSDVIDIVVKSTVADTYLQHAPGVQNRNEQSLTVGRIKNAIFDLGLSWRDKPGEEVPEKDIRAREGLLANTRYLMSTIDMIVLENAALSCEDDIFMEVLINNVRNEVCSYQAFYLNEIKKKFYDGIKRLQFYKKNYEINAVEIAQLEKQLNDYADRDMRAELESYPVFEHLGAEKMCPRFLALAKNACPDPDLSVIKDDNGNAFQTIQNRKDFITSYYADIYAENPDRTRAFEGCVTNFLGPELVNNPYIAGKKVPVFLKNEFESGISLGELDRAIEKMRNNSASGPDGFSVKFVKKYWKLFRVPLCKYFAKCLDTGNLTHTFATASIRLIPKKGDISKLKNWRPISLLNVLYKIGAKALNNRLKRAAPYIISRSQKGFVDKKFIQECLINIAETVHFAEKNRIKSFCLALDQAKAFDSLNHDFMTDVYKFFGFGNQFIKMLNTLTTGRTANILFDDGSKGGDFPLECGNAQGNSPSPLQFNFGEQILLVDNIQRLNLH
jgi:exonuclease III